MVQYEDERYPLHKAAFHNDVQSLSRLLNDPQNNIGDQDPHGNTPLHIAVMLGHKECITLLTSRNAPIKVKNAQGWSVLMEAVSYGDRTIITSLLKRMKAQAREHLASRKPHLMEVLSSLDDFYLEINWDFHSWVPLLSRVLPSDVCKIYKHGTALRMDTTLVDFNDRSWERGDISFIYNPHVEHLKQHLVVLDNKAKVYQKLKSTQVDTDINEEVDVLMSSDIVSAQMSTKPITFERTLSGWFFKHEKSEIVGSYPANYYNVDNLILVSKKRREHLSADDIKKNKTYFQSFANGGAVSESDVKSLRNRPSLPSPSKLNITWKEYILAPQSEYPHLGRPIVEKVNRKAFKAGVGLSPEFPLSVHTLIDILEVIAPLKHMSKLRQFCDCKMPPGFPVRLEIPLLPTITAKITFQKFQWCDNLTMKFFRIPKSYVENPNRFPELNSNQDIYFWPSLTEHEKSVIRDAFYQIERRTCLKFNEIEYKPWYHADRWDGRPYVIVRKSKAFTGYSDNDIEDVSKRSILYLTEKALNHNSFNTSRGQVMNQLVRFMGLKSELFRPDAPSYIQQIDKNYNHDKPLFSDEQLQWPFDPESVTVSFDARNNYELTYYCSARRKQDIGAAQRVGLLTRWDAIKINSMYCPSEVGYADPRQGPCVVPRKGRKSKHEFK